MTRRRDRTEGRRVLVARLSAAGSRAPMERRSRSTKYRKGVISSEQLERADAQILRRSGTAQMDAAVLANLCHASMSLRHTNCWGSRSSAAGRRTVAPQDFN